MKISMNENRVVPIPDQLFPVEEYAFDNEVRFSGFNVSKIGHLRIIPVVKAPDLHTLLTGNKWLQQQILETPVVV